MSEVRVALAALAVLMTCAPSPGQPPLVRDRCGFCCTAVPSTLRQEFASARAVVFGTLANPSMNPAGDEKTAVTDLRVERVLKADPALNGLRVITLNRYVPVADPKKPPRYLIFFDVDKGRLEPYRGLLNEEAAVDYLQGALKLDNKKPGDVLVYFHKHLASPSKDIAGDAFRELQELSHEALRQHAGRLSADSIADRLRSEKTPAWTRSLEAILLGHCGTDRHAGLLAARIEKGLESEDSAGMHGLLIGQTLLKPSEGLANLRKVATDRKSPFVLRYESLKALRYFLGVRKDVLKRDDLIRTMTVMLEQEDIADLIIEEFRRAREEKMVDRILDLRGKKEFDLPIIRRTTLRFCLTFPKNARAADYVEEIRAADPAYVKDTEELLKLEQP